MIDKIFKEEYSNNEIKILITKECHIFKLVDYSLKKNFYKYLEFKVFNRNQAKNYFKKKIENQKIFFYTIFQKNNIVGTFSIHRINKKKKSCEIGYGIDPKFWGKGIFKKLIKLIKKEIFRSGFLEINVLTREDNYPSISGLIKNDFQIIKKIKNFYYDKKTKKKYNAFKLQCLKKNY